MKIMTMTMNKELHPWRDVYRLYVPRTDKGRGLIGCKMCVKAAKNSLGWFVKHRIEPLIVPVIICNIVPSKSSTQPKEFKQQDDGERLNN